MDAIINLLHHLIGPNSTDIVWWQMMFRAFTVFLISLTIVRLGGTRIFGANTTFDIVLGIILGSVLSRAITGNAPYFPTVAAASLLVFLHWGLSWLAVKNSRIGTIIKGKKTLLMKNGKYISENMRKKQITENDFLEALRTKGNIEISKVKYAYLERSGNISIIL